MHKAPSGGKPMKLSEPSAYLTRHAGCGRCTFRLYCQLSLTGPHHKASAAAAFEISKATDEGFLPLSDSLQYLVTPQAYIHKAETPPLWNT